jgi:tetratricopeptide (TPR) repeat protein
MLWRDGLLGRMLLFTAIVLFAAKDGRAQSSSPPAFDNLAAQAAAARDQQNIPLAIELYNKAEELRPDWPEGWWYLGLLQYSARQYAPAIVALDHLLQLDPRAVQAMAIRGLCKFETGSYEDSLYDLDQAVMHGAAADPRHEEIIRVHLGVLLSHAGRFMDALTQYKVLAGKQVDNTNLPLAIGLAGLRSRNLPEELNPQDRALYEAAGEAAYAFLANDSEGADARFRELFARYPTTPNLHYFYGMLLFPHDRTMAAEEFQREVAIDPSNQLATAILAFTLMYVGRYNEAMPVAERALAAAPDMELAQLALGRSLIETGGEKRGIDMLNGVIEHNPKSLEAHVGLVAAYTRAGRKEDAYRERMVCLGLVD